MSNQPASLPEAEQMTAMIRDQSATEATEVTREAEERVKQIRAAAQAEVQTIRATAQREGEERGRRRAAELLAVAEAQSRMELLRVREQLIDQAITAAREQLANLKALPDATSALAALIRETLHAFQPGPLRVYVAAADEPLLDAALRKSLGAGRWALRFATGDLAGGGVIAETEDGRLRYDNSFDARVRRDQVRLRQLAAERLLTGESGEF